MRKPTFGITKSGHEVHAQTIHHIAKAVRFSPSEIKTAMKDINGFNAKFAVLITKSVGTMICAYFFTVLALMSLPAILIQANVLKTSQVPNILTKPGLILIVAWIAQTFIQLVLLSIILVGQDIQSIASDARAEKTFNDTEKIVDALDTKTKTGIAVVRDEIIKAIKDKK